MIKAIFIHNRKNYKCNTNVILRNDICENKNPPQRVIESADSSQSW